MSFGPEIAGRCPLNMCPRHGRRWEFPALMSRSCGLLSGRCRTSSGKLSRTTTWPVCRTQKLPGSSAAPRTPPAGLQPTASRTCERAITARPEGSKAMSDSRSDVLQILSAPVDAETLQRLHNRLEHEAAQGEVL